MREILFRGKRIDNGEWIEGSLWHVHENDYCIISHGNTYGVYPESVGQYTGLKDMNGKKIFEGDIVKTWEGLIGQIVFGSYIDDESNGDCQGWFWKGFDKHCNTFILSLSVNWESHRVIGNIHDKPELLKGGA